MPPSRLLAAAILLISTAGVAAQPDRSGSRSEPRTAAAVLAADEAWSKAEMDGDARYVDWLLLPSYQSVGRDGVATGKAAIVADAASHARSPAYASRAAQWKAQHPLRADVRIIGDTAVLTWISTRPDAGQPVSSSDVFVHSGGRWHAIYSQHSDASV